VTRDYWREVGRLFIIDKKYVLVSLFFFEVFPIKLNPQNGREIFLKIKGAYPLKYVSTFNQRE